MGHRKSIIRQTVERLQDMAAYGDSKHADKLANGGKPAVDKIYSYETMRNYLDAATQFADWARSHGCRTLDEAQQHTGEYLQQRMDRGLSAWTVRRDAAALGKLYQCKTTELGATLPRSETYCCRSDRAGTHYDKAAMGAVSGALGHARLDVVTSYLSK